MGFPVTANLSGSSMALSSFVVTFKHCRREETREMDLVCGRMPL